MDGKGFEPTVETLFGSNGFFPDTISKAMYWVGDKMPNKINEVLQEWVDPLRTEKTKRQVLISIAYSNPNSVIIYVIEFLLHVSKAR